MAERALAKKIDVDGLLASISDESLAHAISRYSGGQPQRTGSGWLVRCPNPSHEDKNPACSVNEKGGVALFHCFVCKMGGNAISWFKLAKGERSPFTELLTELVDEFGGSAALAVAPRHLPTDRSSKSDAGNDEDYLTNIRRRIKKERASGRKAELIIERFAGIKCLPVDQVAGTGLHAALRPHKCEREHGCEADDDWTAVLCVRSPMLDADGEAVGWQDIVPAADAEIHYQGKRKLAAAGCKWPMFGLNNAAGAEVILITEGVTDWLTASVVLTGVAVVGAMGAERMSQTASKTRDAAHEGACMIVVGDGDPAGAEGAEDAMGTWPEQWPAARVVPPDGADISSAWCHGTKSGWPAAWLQVFVDHVVSQAHFYGRSSWALSLDAHVPEPKLVAHHVTPDLMAQYGAWPDEKTSCGVWDLTLKAVQEGTTRHTYITAARLRDAFALAPVEVLNRVPSSELGHTVSAESAWMPRKEWQMSVHVRRSRGGEVVIEDAQQEETEESWW